MPGWCDIMGDWESLGSGTGSWALAPELTSAAGTAATN